MRTVYKNGTVYTGNGFVTDFAVENGKFCFWAKRIKPRQMK